MQKFIYLLLSFCFMAQLSFAQLTSYIVEFTNKNNSSFSLNEPETFLSERALQNRRVYNISFDSTDLPITEAYLDSLTSTGAVNIITKSKWLNQVVIKTSDNNAITRIQNFSFVKNIWAAARQANNSVADKFGIEVPANNINNDLPQTELTNKYNYGQSYNQVHLNKGEFLHNLGFSGEGMHLAVLDAGFPNYLTLPTFDSVRNNNQILGTWDFVNNQPNVNSFHQHGTYCFSVMAANMPGIFVGSAPKASYYLFRTEDAPTEYIIEEHNLAVALEKADSLGVNMASISLGYTTFDNPAFNHSYADMNGDITMAARAADLAAKKGMLVVAAAGNDGANTWNFLGTPADADSILTVGAVDATGTVAGFSSFGPSSDGQIKPSVASMGVNTTIANVATGQPTTGSGTSFACPNLAGLTSCLWQAFPEANNMEIIDALQQAGSKFNNPDDRVGYGIPDMKRAFAILLNKYYQQQIRQEGCETNISFSVKSNRFFTFEIERKLPTDADFVSVETKAVTGDFKNNIFSFIDDLSAISPANISYRIKINIDTDTSYYFAPVIINHLNPCLNYTFIGNGNYSEVANWLSGLMPPSILPAGSTIIINPAANGTCLLNVTQQILPGGKFEVRTGKKLIIAGDLQLQ